MDIGMHTQFDDATTAPNPLIRGIAADISLGAWEGIIWNRLSAPLKPVGQEEFEIYDRSRTAQTGVIGNGSGTGWADGTATTDLPLPAASIGILTVGDVIKVESEIVMVSSVDRNANTIDVVARGHGSTSGAAHVDTTAFTIIGKAINDTDLKNMESFAENSGKWTNYCQLFSEIIQQTFTDQNEPRKGFEGQQRLQLLKEAMDRVFRRLSKTCILGVKSAGSASSPSTTAGILEQLQDSTNRKRAALRYNASGVTSPEIILKNSLIACWNAGGNPTHIYLSPTNKRKFDALTEQFIRMTRGEAKLIGTDNATSYMFQGKQLDFVQDQDWPDDRIALVTESMLHKGWKVGDMLRGPVPEPKLSSREDRESIQGKCFIEVEGVGVDHVDIHTVSLA